MTVRGSLLDEATRALGATIRAALDAGGRVPCLGRGEWLADDPDSAEFAAHHCTSCPVLDACQAAADVLKPTAGVWAATSYPARGGHRETRTQAGRVRAPAPNVAAA